MPGGAKFTFQGSALSHDGTYILAPSCSSLRLYSSVTGGQIGQLDGHGDNICCVATHAKNSNQVYTASKDGTLRLWDYITLECLRTIHVKETVVDMVFHPERPIAYMSIHREGASGRIITYDLENSKAGRTAMKTSVARPLYCSGHSRGVGGTAQTFVATFDRQSLLVWRVGEDIYQPLNLRHTKPFTCASLNADETAIAAGDASGRILIWRGFASHVPKAKQESQGTARHHTEELNPTTVHWHASAVGCLSFTPDGAYLLSGGKEAVLVLWKVDGSGQDFLPRLGGPLAAIQPMGADPAKALVAQADNTLRIVNLGLKKVQASVLGVRPLPEGLAPRSAANATLLQPGTGFLLLPSENGEMQLYDTLHDRHVSLFKVVNRNSVALAERPYTGQGPQYQVHPGQASQAAAAPAAPVQPYVSHAAFVGGGSGGTVLVTVDVRPPVGGALGASSAACLRFWDASPGAATVSGLDAPFTLNTRVDEPHSGGVVALAASSVGDLVVSVGRSDTEFKLWERAAAGWRPGGSGKDVSNWRCRALGGYKGLPLSAAAFSTDGSALALSAGPKLTIWDPLTCRLAAVLSLPPYHHPIAGPAAAAAAAGGNVVRRVAFIAGSPYVVGATDGCVAVWDLLAGALLWVLDLANSSLISDPMHGLFAVVSPTASKKGSITAEGSHVLVFDPRNPAPRFHCACPGTAAPTLLFAGPGMPQAEELGAGGSGEGVDGGRPATSPLLMVTEHRTLQYITPPATTTAGPRKPAAASQQDQQASRFEDAFGALRPVVHSAPGAEEGSMDVDMDADPNKPRWAQLFDAPSHALPPPTALAEAFLRLINA